jgi:tetratricopeptide (TPR) repeat protein
MHGWQQIESIAFGKGKTVLCRRLRGERRIARGFLTGAILVLCAVSYSRAQGMSAGFSGSWHLASASNEKDASQMLGDLRAARVELAVHPKSAEAHFSLGVALQTLGESDAASHAFDEALSLDAKLPRAWYQKGVLSADKERWSEAEELFRRALASSEDFLPARLGLAEMLIRTGDFDGATRELKSALSLDAKNAGAHYGLGLVYLQNGALDDAAAEFRKALELRPGDTDSQQRLADVYLLQRKWTEAAALLRQVVAAKPRSAEAATALGTALENEGDRRASQEQFARARQLMRDETNLLRAKGESNFGVALRNENKLPEAVAAFHRALDDAPAFCEAHDDLGAVLWLLKDYAAGMAESEAAVQCDPGLASARNNLGVALLYYKQDRDHAIEQFRAAIAAKPGFALAHLNLAKTLASEQQFGEAESEFRQAIALAPEIAAAHVGLGLLLATRAGKVSAEAKAELDEGLRLDRSLKATIPREFATQLD